MHIGKVAGEIFKNTRTSHFEDLLPETMIQAYLFLYIGIQKLNNNNIIEPMTKSKSESSRSSVVLNQQF